jgi:hypothetical protein
VLPVTYEQTCKYRNQCKSSVSSYQIVDTLCYFMVRHTSLSYFVHFYIHYQLHKNLCLTLHLAFQIVCLHWGNYNYISCLQSKVFGYLHSWCNLHKDLGVLFAHFHKLVINILKYLEMLLSSHVNIYELLLNMSIIVVILLTKLYPLPRKCYVELIIAIR